MATANKALNQPANNSNINTWDVPVNANFGFIDQALGAVTTLTVTGASGTNVLTSTQYVPCTIKLTGVLTADVIYQIPSGVGGFWFVTNSSTGAHSITFNSGGAGTSVVIPQGFNVTIVSDGTNIFRTNTASGSAAGSTTQVQYNSSGNLAGSANLVFNGTDTLTVKSKLVLSGSSSGAITVQGLAASGTYNFTLPNSAGSNGQFLTTDGTGNLSWTGATGGVTSISFSTTGLTPSTATSGAVTVGGTLGTGFGGTGLTAFTSGGAVYATSTSALTTGTLPVGSGGTGVSSTPTNGQILIGNGTGFSLATITAGTNITVTNSAGGITIASSNSGGSVTSVNVSGGTTGLTTSGGPVTGSGTITVAGTLVVANGGTGASTASGARTNLGLGTAATQNTGTSGANVPLLNGANTWAATQTFSVAPVFTDQSGSRTALGLGTAATAATGTSGHALGFLDGNNTYSGSSIFSGTVTLQALLTTATSGAGAAPVNIPIGTAPSSPNNGDFWPTSSGLFFRVGGVTTQLATTAAALLVANNLSDLNSASTARTNLGLGTAATHAATDFLLVANNLSDLNNAGTARTNLGLGSAATVNTGTSGATIPLLNGANTYSGASTFSAGVTITANAQTTPVAVVFSATAMTVDCSKSNVFTTTFTANVTVAPTISNPNDGQTINWFITQDGTGGRTMTWPSSFKWPGGAAGVLSTGINAVDLLVATYRASTSSWYANLLKDFA